MFEAESEFIPPPEAPVFEPTWEEFKDPLGYLNKIRPIAEKSGICKIKPPQDWNPPFAVDLDTFKFTPRVQRLNELEAKTRIKLNFLDQLAKFWELQGSSLKIPLVDKKILDLYMLRQVVNEEGGFEMVCRDRKWSKVCARMNFQPTKGVGSALRQHYEKLLYPYDIFKMGALIDPKKLDEALSEENSKQQKTPEKREVVADQAPTTPGNDTATEDGNVSKELARLQFFGAGPKAAIPPGEALSPEESPKGKKNRIKTREKRPISYTDTYMCNVCGRGDLEDCMLLCDGCDDAFHTYCLIPPLETVPRGDWRCPKCVAKEVSRPKEAFGFEQAHKEYSLQSFGEMADQFKLDYFNMPVHMVPCSTVEKEFWRLVNSLEEDVYVEYGADIHAAEMGSGFPTPKNKFLFDNVDTEIEEYMQSGWNLNNLPVQDKSVLRYINVDISGMKVPWCYVGMCFSSFCWHIEDHWSYSINYMHWGEPKTWYGVPGAKAQLLEECMKKNAPELFEQSPDLLHQLTTIMNPNILMAYGVPVVRTNQHAGEFIVTFPRAYHAGFNQGYNFAEAVNFCPADWLPMGSQCIEHYRMLHRQCVFSHEELVCKMAVQPDQLDVHMAEAVHKEMVTMVEKEVANRKALLKQGVGNSEREAFELIPDDERQCAHCVTTCFLSAVTCSCSSTRLVCVEHVQYLCECPPANHTLRYRYTLDELPPMLARLNARAEAYNKWAKKVEAAMDAPQEDKLEWDALRDLVLEAKEHRLPDCELLQELEEAVSDAKKCGAVAVQLVSCKVRTRCRQSGESKYVAKLTVAELEEFCEQIYSLPCVVKEGELVKELLHKVKTFSDQAKVALKVTRPNTNVLESLLEEGMGLDIDTPEINVMKDRLNVAKWLDEVDKSRSESSKISLETIRRLIDAGVSLIPYPTSEMTMAQLQEVLTTSEEVEERAKECLQGKPRVSQDVIQCVIQEGSKIPAVLPNCAALSEAIKKACEWNSKVRQLQNATAFPYLDVLEGLVGKARSIPVTLDMLPPIEASVTSAQQWKDRTARTFLKKNSIYTLLEVLSPRVDIGIPIGPKMRRKKLREGEKETIAHVLGVDADEALDAQSVVRAFKRAEELEFESMKELRSVNIQKQNNPDVQFCVCQRASAGFMLQCELCKDWFHSTCVTLPKSAKSCSKNSTTDLQERTKDLKYLCPLCLRSRRPRLETILSLLVALQKLPIRLPEGEALQCLTERAMAWQDKSRQVLGTNELASALAQISMQHQRLSEQAAREKTDKIISAEIKKAQLQGHLQQVGHSSVSPGDEDSRTSLPPRGGHDGQDSMDEEYEGPSDVIHKHIRKSQQVIRQDGDSIYGQCRVNLTDKMRLELEELMMEGDLLEVSLDELVHIWKLLQAGQSAGIAEVIHPSESDLDTNAFDINTGGDPALKEKKKKRKKDDGTTPKVDKQKKKKVIDKDGKPKEKKKRQTEGKGSRQRDDTVVVINDEEDICSAAKCIHPIGEEVNWVQCDRCEEWFHMICIGVSQTDISAEQDYICWRCRNKQEHSAAKVLASLTRTGSTLKTPTPSPVKSAALSAAAEALTLMAQGGMYRGAGGSRPALAGMSGVGDLGGDSDNDRLQTMDSDSD